MLYPQKYPPTPAANVNLSESECTMFTGKIKFYNEGKGWGFVSCDDGGPDLFVHATGVNTDNGFPILTTGDAVEFSIGEGRKGPLAENVRKLPKLPKR